MKKIVLILLTSCSFLVFCARKTLIRNYYLIEFPQTIAQSESAQSFPLEVDVRDFRVSRAFEQTRIALRTDTKELNYFYYHHWAVRPAYALADQVHTVFDQKGLFAKCTRGLSADPNYIIGGNVQILGGNHKDDPPTAHLSMTLFFMDAESSVSNLQHRFDRSLPLDDKSMNSYAEKLSQILLEETLVFYEQISEYLQNRQ